MVVIGEDGMWFVDKFFFFFFFAHTPKTNHLYFYSSLQIYWLNKQEFDGCSRIELKKICINYTSKHQILGQFSSVGMRPA